MMIKQYDEIRLKDGREGCAVEVFGDGTEVLVDVGSSPKDWDTIRVTCDDVEEIIHSHTNKG